MMPRSVPACASVNAIAPAHSPAVQLRQIQRLLRLAAVVGDARRRADRQRAAQIQAGIRRVEHLFERDRQHLRQTLAAVVRIARDTEPAAVRRARESPA